MNLHEYQAKDVFRSFGIPVPAGHVAGSPEEAVAAAQSLGGPIWVVKAQVHAGGRGKAGGVKVVRDLEAVRSAAAGMLGQRLVTPQTGAEGLPIDKVYVESGSQIARELYLSLTLNRDKGRIALIASSAGGMDIEEVAAHTPEKIVAVTVHPAAGLQPYQCRKLAFALGFEHTIPEWRFGPGPRTYGHNGSGGSLAIVDPDAGLSLGYAMNRLWWGADRSDPRWAPIFDALYGAL